MARYYKIVSRRVTFAEYWRLASGISFLIAAGAKFFSTPLDFKTGVPWLEDLIPLDESLAAQTPLGELVVEAERAGLVKQFYYTIPMLGPATGLACGLLSADGLVAGNAMYSRSKLEGGAPLSASVLALITPLQNGKFIGTINKKRELNSTPKIEGEYLPGASAADTLARHRERLRSTKSAPQSLSVQGLWDFIVRQHNDEIQFHLERGVYASMTKEEEEVLRAEFS